LSIIIFPFDENSNVNQPASAVQVRRGRKVVTKNKAKSVPRLKSIDELVEFFDKHDMGDCWDRLPQAEFEVKINTPKHLIAIDEKIIPSINQIARSKKVTSAKLINRWLREKITTSKRA
jgi:hypothetical protein